MGLPRFRPPQPRHKAYVDTMGKALKRASTLTTSEIADTMAPARACEKRLREGVATQDQLIVLRTQLRIAMGIEHTGIVRGLREHLTTALQALDKIEDRSSTGHTWRQSPLHYYELDAIRTAVHLHEFQLKQVSAGELRQVALKLIAQTQSSGGELRRYVATELGLEAAR